MSVYPIPCDGCGDLINGAHVMRADDQGRVANHICWDCYFAEANQIEASK